MHLRADRRLARPLAARLHAQPERNVLEHRHVAEQRIVLEHEADLPLARADRRDVEPLQHDLPRIRVLEARDHAQQRRLAAAGRAEQRDELTRGEIERDVVERGELAEAFVQITNGDAHLVCLFTKSTK